MTEYNYSYIGLVERAQKVTEAEALGYMMLHDNYDSDWETEQEVRGILVFTDEIPPPPPPPAPALCTRMAKLLSVNAGIRPAHVEVYLDLAPTGFEYDCYVSETVYTEYTAGHIIVGDFLLVEFVDDLADAGCVFAKVHKTW